MEAVALDQDSAGLLVGRIASGRPLRRLQVDLLGRGHLADNGQRSGRAETVRGGGGGGEAGAGASSSGQQRQQQLQQEKEEEQEEGHARGGVELSPGAGEGSKEGGAVSEGVAAGATRAQLLLRALLSSVFDEQLFDHVEREALRGGAGHNGLPVAATSNSSLAITLTSVTSMRLQLLERSSEEDGDAGGGESLQARQVADGDDRDAPGASERATAVAETRPATGGAVPADVQAAPGGTAGSSGGGDANPTSQDDGAAAAAAQHGGKQAELPRGEQWTGPQAPSPELLAASAATSGQSDALTTFVRQAFHSRVFGALAAHAARRREGARPEGRRAAAAAAGGGAGGARAEGVVEQAVAVARHRELAQQVLARLELLAAANRHLSLSTVATWHLTTAAGEEISMEGAHGVRVWGENGTAGSGAGPARPPVGPTSISHLSWVILNQVAAHMLEALEMEAMSLGLPSSRQAFTLTLNVAPKSTASFTAYPSAKQHCVLWSMKAPLAAPSKTALSKVHIEGAPSSSPEFFLGQMSMPELRRRLTNLLLQT
eukprot:jgi/Mesen1/1591/ME000134S00710